MSKRQRERGEDEKNYIANMTNGERKRRESVKHLNTTNIAKLPFFRDIA